MPEAISFPDAGCLYHHGGQPDVQTGVVILGARMPRQLHPTQTARTHLQPRDRCANARPIVDLGAEPARKALGLWLQVALSGPSPYVVLRAGLNAHGTQEVPHNPQRMACPAAAHLLAEGRRKLHRPVGARGCRHRGAAVGGLIGCRASSRALQLQRLLQQQQHELRQALHLRPSAQRLKIFP